MADRKDEPRASAATEKAIIGRLDAAYLQAHARYESKAEPNWKLKPRFLTALRVMSDKAAPPGSTGFTNLITCLAIKSALPKHDIRNHQVQIGAPFGFRTFSETVVHPWLRDHGFQGAKSGWQTRTFERDHPYTMDYPHKITPSIRLSFLTFFDEVEEQKGDTFEALTFLIFNQIQLQETKKAMSASAQLDYDGFNDIAQIVSMFDKHFAVRATGTARLPVLAVYAIYQVMMQQVGRYEGKHLRELERHSAADIRTGSLGDIEVARKDNTIFEALEIKHRMAITENIVVTCKQKIEQAPYRVDRYYILTTHPNCKPTVEMNKRLRVMASDTGCQVVIDGVLPTIQYYLRLLTEPGLVLPEYLKLLTDEPAISPGHIEAWNKILHAEI